jgi:hypothetical protein
MGWQLVGLRGYYIQGPTLRHGTLTAPVRLRVLRGQLRHSPYGTAEVKLGRNEVSNSRRRDARVTFDAEKGRRSTGSSRCLRHGRGLKRAGHCCGREENGMLSLVGRASDDDTGAPGKACVTQTKIPS